MGGLKKRVRNLQPPLTGWGNYLLQDTRVQQFSREKDPTGKPWSRLAPATVREKRRLGYGSKKILERTGDFQRTLFFEASKKTFVWGLRSQIASYHQYGTRKMPARVIIGLNATRKQKGYKLIKVYIVGRRR